MTQITIGFFGSSGGGGLTVPTLQSQATSPTPEGDHTVTFDAPRKIGQYSTGGWWFLGGSDITALAPAGVAAMISPAAGVRDHGYFPNLYTSSLSSFYKSALDKSAMPQTMAPGDTLILGVPEDPLTNAPPNLQTAETFTCVATEPASNEFRPPYIARTAPTKVFTEAMIDMSRVDNRVSSATMATHGETIAIVLPKLQRVWLDHLETWVGRYSHPLHNMPDYGGPMSELLGTAMLLCNSDLSNAEKYPLVRQLCQIGIDFWELWREGHSWAPDGGHMSGRLPTILFAMHVLNQPEMNAFEAAYDPADFGESAQCFIVEETSPGIYNQNFGDYTAADVGTFDWGVRHLTTPGWDSRWWDRHATTHTGSPSTQNVAQYRRSSTATYWYGCALSLRAMGIIDAMGPAYGGYMDRYEAQMPNDPYVSATYPTNEHYRNAAHKAVWDQLRASL